VRLDAYDPLGASLQGPLVPPGTYTVELAVGDQVAREPFNVYRDSFSDTPEEDMRAQFSVLLHIRDTLSEANSAVNRMRRVRGQLDDWTKRLESEDISRPLADSARELKERVLTIEKTLMMPDLKKGWPSMLNHGIQLTRRLAALAP